MLLQQVIKKLLIKEPFIGLFLLGIDREYNPSIPTACVARCGINCVLQVNQEWWETLSDDDQYSTLLHEAEHLLYKHLWLAEEYDDSTRFNFAADCVVNSDIPNLQKDPYVYPQLYNLPEKKGVKFYYENLPEEIKQQTVDWHGSWKDFQGLSDSEKQLVEGQIDFQAKNAAEQTIKTCGNIPGQFKEYIDSLFKKKEAVFNWKAYFRRLLGNSIIMFLKNTRYMPSKRFLDSPGLILKSKPKVLVAVDTSGSVSNNELSDFFTEIQHLYKSGVQVDIVEFDTRIHTRFTYKGPREIVIGGRGGTDVTEVFELYKQRKDYSTLVVFTDGYLSLNLPKCQNVIWVISSNGSEQDYPGHAVYIPKEKK